MNANEYCDVLIAQEGGMCGWGFERWPWI